VPITKTDRESIIKESIHLFKVHGYYSTTMANIGEACGLIKGSIYHHFKSKEDLALECLQHIHEIFEKDIFSIAYRKNIEPLVRFQLFTKAVEKYFLNSEGGCLLGNFALEISNNIPSLKNEIIDYFNHWESALYEILKTEFGEKAAKEKATQIVASTQGSIMLMRLHNSPKQFKNQNKEILNLLS
jgi:AcrR family transcriptional regulator